MDASPPCRHGVPDDGASMAEMTRIVEECDRLLNEIDDVNQRVGAFFDFWSHPSHSHVVTKELAALYFATATNALLDDDDGPKMEDFSYIETTYGIDILEMAQKGVDTFIQDLRQHGQSHENAQIVHQIATRHGLLSYLAKAIPCTCLDNLVQEQKGGSQTFQDGNVPF